MSVDSTLEITVERRTEVTSINVALVCVKCNEEMDMISTVMHGTPSSEHGIEFVYSCSSCGTTCTSHTCYPYTTSLNTKEEG